MQIELNSLLDNGVGAAVKVLIIEDDQQVVSDLHFCLGVRYPEVTVISVGDGHKGRRIVETDSPDLVVVDSPLCGMDILELVRQIRDFSEVPLIILSENKNDNDMDIAKVLEAGADEYVTKPFRPIEFLARIRALLRRTHGVRSKYDRSISIGELTINFATNEVLISEKPVKLTPIESRLLSELVINEGRVLTHSRLLEKIWGSDYTTDSSFVKKYIYRLRSKIQPDKSKPRMIFTEWGIGYKFVRPV